MPTGSPTKLKRCSVCGELFTPTKPSSKICKKDHMLPCPICGKLQVWNSARAIEPCSKECRKERTRRNYIQKYGVDHPMKCKAVQEHHKAAMKEKYGVEHALQSAELKQKASETIQERFGTEWALSSPAVRKKSEQTMIQRYGAKTTFESDVLKSRVQATMENKYGQSNPAKVQQLRDKAIQTNMKKYGAPNPMMIPEFQAKAVASRKDNIQAITEAIKQTLLTRYGVDNPAKIPEVREKISASLRAAYPSFKDKMIETNMERYGVPYYCMTDDCKEAQGQIISATNRSFGKLLEANGIEYKFEHRINSNSYDIQVNNTLIELDPTYTHNAIGNHWGASVEKYYHRDKTQLAEDNGFRCIHVFDWDDWDKIVDLLRPTKRVFARKCTIYKLNPDIGDEFLNKYHLQRTCRGQLLYLGLVFDDELLQVMTFGKSRYDKSYDVELLRLCTKPGYTIVGGASRLFSYATNEYGLSNIISYCDRSKFSGNVYEKMGMTLKRITPPQEIWSKGDEKITANLLRARGYDQLFGTEFGKGTSNEELMLSAGYLPVYDCGMRVYVF